jgi:hypothetical protein
MLKRTLIVISFLVVASIALVACGAQAEPFECTDELGCVSYAADDPIRIASALVISGPNTQLGLDSQYGVEIAMDMRGQVAGHDVELQAEDDGCNAEGGQAAGQKIVSDPTIVGVVGTSCSGAGVPMSEVISEAGYFMVSPSNTAPSLTDPDQAWNPGYYRTAHTTRCRARPWPITPSMSWVWIQLPPSTTVTPTQKGWRTPSPPPLKGLAERSSSLRL